MRLEHYLTEQYIVGPVLDNILSKINNECKPFLKELKGANKFLYRGTRPFDDDIEKKIVRTDRKPKLIEKELHNKLDEYTKKKFGWHMRTEGLFTTNNIRTAKNFSVDGNVVLVFPIGKFEYMYYSDVEYLYSLYDTYIIGNERDFNDITDEIDQYKTNKLHQYLADMYNKPSECVIHCKEYYIVNYEHEDNLRQLLGMK